MKHRTLFFISAALFILLITVLTILFFPNMSATLINTIPEYPPEFHSFDSNEAAAPTAVNVDKTNVKNIISAIKRPEEYFSETRSTISHASGSASFPRQKWVKGDLARVDIFSSVSSQNASVHHIYTTDSVYSWRTGERSYYKTSRGSFEADDEQMMLSYEDIISAKDEDIITAQLTMYDGVSCVYAEVKSPDTGYINRYWVSYSTGLLVFGQTLNPEGNVVYSVTATQTDISPQSMETFRLPDGALPS